MRRPGGDAVTVRRAALRLGLQAGAGALAVVLLVLVTVAVTLVRDTRAQEDALLASAADQADDVGDPPAGTWIVLRTGREVAATPGLPAGLPLTDSLDRVAAGGPAEDTAATVAGRDVRVRTQVRPGHPGTIVQAVLDASPGEARLASLLRAVTIAALAGLLVVVAAGSWVARRAVAPLEATLALQRRFVADAGHELRTPVTLLSTRAQLLRRAARRDAPGDVTAAADALVADAEHLATILDDLLLTADPGAGAPAGPVDLAEVVAAVAASAAPAAAAAGVELVVDAPSAAVVPGAETGLRRAITAVVDNAVRHAASRVALTVTPGRGSVTVEVRDDGPGIDAELLPRLFERFATAGGVRPDGRRGYGIGLALVREVVARHGGTVEAHNPPGGGAAFAIVVPAGAPTRSRRARRSG